MKKLIKFKDLTADQYNMVIYNLCELTYLHNCSKCPLCGLSCNYLGNSSSSCFNNKDKLSEAFLNQEFEVNVPDILDKNEKEYLSFIIKPFKDDVIRIMKCQSSIGYNITIKTNNIGYLKFPTFSKDKDMYKNMKIDYPYTVKELDL